MVKNIRKFVIDNPKLSKLISKKVLKGDGIGLDKISKKLNKEGVKFKNFIVSNPKIALKILEDHKKKIMGSGIQKFQLHKNPLSNLVPHPIPAGSGIKDDLIKVKEKAQKVIHARQIKDAVIKGVEKLKGEGIRNSGFEIVENDCFDCMGLGWSHRLALSEAVY